MRLYSPSPRVTLTFGSRRGPIFDTTRRSAEPGRGKQRGIPEKRAGPERGPSKSVQSFLPVTSKSDAGEAVSLEKGKEIR